MFCNKFPIYALIVLLACVPLASSSVRAQCPPVSEAQNSTQHGVYKIGFYLISVGSIDKETGTTKLVFWLYEESNDTDFTKNPSLRFEFVNGYAKDSSLITCMHHFYREKVRGVFYNDFNYKNYPFENQHITVLISPIFPNTADKVMLVPDIKYDGISKASFTSLPGYELTKIHVASVFDRYPTGNFSDIRVDIPLTISTWGTFTRYMTPILLLGAFSIGGLFLPHRYMGDRLTIISAAFISAIFFQSTFLDAQLPPLDYLTFADKAMLAAYTIFGLSLFDIVVHKCSEEKVGNKYLVKIGMALHGKIIWVAPATGIAVFLCTVFL
ncbi:MAG: hypothetical protein KGI33_07325 [Thaumarchaeota archaeon]|nr:hypothetical protein [Nitrososphaerota archaeon]